MHPSEVIERTIGANVLSDTASQVHCVINIPTCHMNPLLVMMPGSAFIRRDPWTCMALPYISPGSS